MELTAGQLAALRDLLSKADDRPVDFVNIGDARALTELGLATRTGQGWAITAAGRSHLQAEDRNPAADPGPDGDNIIGFDPPGKPRR